MGMNKDIQTIEIIQKMPVELINWDEVSKITGLIMQKIIKNLHISAISVKK
jgi:hypothetical protein